MELYLIRHADAVALGEQGINEDADRPLSDEGESQTRALARALTGRGVHLDAVVSSPLLRARETAEGLRQVWPSPLPETSLTDELAPGGKRRKLVKLLRDLGVDSVALVGHQPELGQLVGWLIGSKKAQIDMAKAGVAHIACPDGPGKGKGVLLTLITPVWFGLNVPAEVKA
jgi:phosphohistidine phosphatase